MNVWNEFEIICTEKGKPKYIRVPIDLIKKAKRVFGLRNRRESPDPLNHKTIAQPRFFYIGWNALSLEKQQLALKLLG